MVVDSKNRWSGFPNPLVPFLTHPVGVGKPAYTNNDAGIGIALEHDQQTSFSSAQGQEGVPARVRTDRDALELDVRDFGTPPS